MHQWFIGLDDTDILGSPGTNKIAILLARELLQHGISTRIILRHQLWQSSRVPFTSQNGSASMAIQSSTLFNLEWLFGEIKTFLLRHFVEGSDPGFSFATREQADQLVSYGWKATREWVEPSEAFEKAKQVGAALFHVAGRNHGVVGALAALGLAASGEQGRVVFHELGFDTLTGMVFIENLSQWHIQVQEEETNIFPSSGMVILPKKLRPNIRSGAMVLFVEKTQEHGIWQALKRD